MQASRVIASTTTALMLISLLGMATIAGGQATKPAQGSEQGSPKDRLEAAVRPFTDSAREAAKLKPLRYALGAGTVNKNGDVVKVKDGTPGDSLDCSCFASAVLHRGQNSSYSTFDAKIQQKWGDGIASAYGLKEAYSKSVVDSLKSLEDGGLPVGVFFFDLRDKLGKEKKEGGAGHVGFLIVEGTGKGEQTVSQIHMSSAKAATGLNLDGLAMNSLFAEFLRGTKYGNSADAQTTSQLTLYEIK